MKEKLCMFPTKFLFQVTDQDSLGNSNIEQNVGNKTLEIYYYHITENNENFDVDNLLNIVTVICILASYFSVLFKR